MDICSSISSFLMSIFQSKENVKEQRRALYLECCQKIEKIVNDNYLIFDNGYFEILKEYKGKIKLIASKKVIVGYKKYFEFIVSVIKPFQAFCNENDPFNKAENYEIYLDEETSTEDEICHVTEHDEWKFEYEIKKYKEEHCPSAEDINREVNNLLNLMRNDFGNKEFEI